jgi:hypothetical protein
MTIVKGAGRSDIADLLTKSGVFDGQKLLHHPFLVFPVISSDGSEDVVEVKIAKTPSELLSFPDDTEVMVQWPGQFRSDFFHFKVIDYKRFLDSSSSNAY